MPADVTIAEQVSHAPQHPVAEFGRLDILVKQRRPDEVRAGGRGVAEDWDDMVSVNVAGVLDVTRAALPHLIEAAAQCIARCG